MPERPDIPEHAPIDRAILLTPSGPAAIAVVRLCGPGVARFLARHFSRPVGAGRCVHGKLADAQREIDDPLVVLLPGDRGADVCLHGGPWVVRSLLELAAREGFDASQSGASTPPSEAIDAHSPVEHEVVAALPSARTELALRMLLAQPAAWRRLQTRLAGKSLNRQGQADELRRILADRSLHWMLNTPRVAVVGAPNAGKSTLANRLFAQERSITADLPGTTRDWVGEVANVSGLAVMLIDTPGLRETDDPIERDAIERGRGQIATADLVVLVLDASEHLEPDQARLLSAYPDALRVINKADKPAAWDIERVPGTRTIATSGEGLGELSEQIVSYFGCANVDPELPRCWTQRQRELLVGCLRV